MFIDFGQDYIFIVNGAKVEVITLEVQRKFKNLIPLGELFRLKTSAFSETLHWFRVSETTGSWVSIPAYALPKTFRTWFLLQTGM